MKLILINTFGGTDAWINPDNITHTIELINEKVKINFVNGYWIIVSKDELESVLNGTELKF